MWDPVIARDGHTYERDAISKWLSSHSTSPKTRQRMDGTLTANYALKNLIADWRVTHRPNEEREEQKHDGEVGVNGQENRLLETADQAGIPATVEVKINNDSDTSNSSDDAPTSD